MFHIKDLDIEDKYKEYLQKYMKTANENLLSRMKLETMPQNTIFIRENEDVDTVFILLSGAVRAVDYRIHGIAYEFMSFEPVKVLGAMEIILNIPKYRTTLITETSCTVLVCPAKEFAAWILNDLNSIKMEMESIGNYLLEEDRQNRMFLFLQGRDRLFVLLLQYYEKNGSKETCTVHLTRSELSDRTGISIRTINRSVKKMEEEGFICKSNSKIMITKAQYEKILAYISGKIIC